MCEFVLGLLFGASVYIGVYFMHSHSITRDRWPAPLVALGVCTSHRSRPDCPWSACARCDPPTDRSQKANGPKPANKHAPSIVRHRMRQRAAATLSGSNFVCELNFASLPIKSNFTYLASILQTSCKYFQATFFTSRSNASLLLKH